MNYFEAEQVLAGSPDHRILKRVPPVANWTLEAKEATEPRRAVFMDTETTGLNQDSDEVIELALLPFEYDRTTGAILRVFESEAYEGLRQPSFAIPAESTKVHGIRDADVAGRSIDMADIERVMAGTHLVIAHNAAFDRPMVEKHWAMFEALNWACSLNDIIWRDEGVGSGKLEYLLMSQGWFYDSHRALTDAVAGVYLLSRQLPLSKRKAMQALLDNARRSLRAVRAENTSYEARAALKQRGYRWDAGDANRAKAWWIMTEDSDAEIIWLNNEIYSAPTNPPVINMPATRRYSSRLWS